MEPLTVSVPVSRELIGDNVLGRLLEDEIAFGLSVSFLEIDERFLRELARYGWASIGRPDVAAAVSERIASREHEWDESVYLPYGWEVE